MSFWVGFKISTKSKRIYLEYAEDFETAMEVYKHTKSTAQPGEIITPPFAAETEEEAWEKVKEIIEE